VAHPSRSAVLASLLLSLAGCATTAPSEKAAAAPAKGTLFDRLGGMPAIEAVVDELFARIAADPKLNASFAGAPIPRTRRRLIEFVCMAAGGPCTYSGRDMKSSHAGMGVTSAQFDALAGHLVGALDKFKVPEREKSELLSLVAPTKADIVEEP
jgi:hemoglobin